VTSERAKWKYVKQMKHKVHEPENVNKKRKCNTPRSCAEMFYTVVSLVKKGKVIPVTGHGGP
jgi:hypothetical protein